jgi:hypothetical protein
VFETLKKRWGSSAMGWTAYGDGDEEKRAADKQRIPFRKIQTLRELESLTRGTEQLGGNLPDEHRAPLAK